MTPSSEMWVGLRRDLLAKLQTEIEPFARSGAFDAAAYRAATSQTVASLSQLTRAVPYYLGRKFDEARKIELCAFHYDWLIGNVTPSGLVTLIGLWVPLWETEAEGTIYRMAIRIEPYGARVGELSLRMWAGDLSLFVLSFTFVPAALVRRPAGPALLVSRMQGAAGHFDELRRASRALCDVAPRAVTFAGLTGVANACGVEIIAGNAAENCKGYYTAARGQLLRQYDEFFQALNAEGPQDGLFVVDLAAPPKPMREVKAGHRIRTRRKRALKKEIAAASAQAWARQLAMPRD